MRTLIAPTCWSFSVATCRQLRDCRNPFAGAAQVDSDDQYINDARSVRGLTLALVFMCMLTVTQMMQVLSRFQHMQTWFMHHRLGTKVEGTCLGHTSRQAYSVQEPAESHFACKMHPSVVLLAARVCEGRYSAIGTGTP